jgi:hypothetical protein
VVPEQAGIPPTTTATDARIISAFAFNALIFLISLVPHYALVGIEETTLLV